MSPSDLPSLETRLEACLLELDRLQRDRPRAPDGRFFLVRGYQEDASENPTVETGTIFDLTLPIWRTGEVLLHAASMARQFGAAQARVIIIIEWSGLADRRLAAFANPNRLLVETYSVRQNTYRTRAFSEQMES